MQFSGSLEDVSIIDVLQILGLTGKDGKLQIQTLERSAEVMFRAGRVTAARLSAQQVFMTNRLMQKGQIGFETLHEALQRQRELPSGQERPIGSILVELGAITQEQLRQALYEHIQEVINEVAGWTMGSFSFELGAVVPEDGLGLFPGDLDVQPQVSLQELLLEAARVYDEARQSSRDSASWNSAEGSEELPGVEEAGVLLVTDDLLVQYGLENAPDAPAVTLCSSLAGLDAHLRARAVAPRILVFDLDLDLDHSAPHNAGCTSPLDFLRPLLERDPDSRILTFGRAVPSWLLELMAISSRVGLVPRPPPAIFRDPGVARAFVDALLARIHPARGPSSQVEVCTSADSGAHLRRLYQSVLGLRSSRHSMTVSLELLRYVAELLERAVLLLVQEGGLVALGIFGVPSTEGRPACSQHGRLRVPLLPDSVLAEVVRSQLLVHHRFGAEVGDAGLAALFAQIGAPVRPEAFLVPLVVRNRTFAVVYTDNGARDAPLGPGEAVGVLAEHGSQLLENLLLVRQRERCTKAARPSAEQEPQHPPIAVPDSPLHTTAG